jgi:ribosome-binding factor A
MKNPISNRQQRVAMLINSALVEALRRGKILGGYVDKSPITITQVRVTADFKIAHCYFVPFNTSLSINQIENLLQELRFSIRAFVTDQIKLKYSPEIRFHYDKGFDNLTKIEQILKGINSSDKILENT